MSQTSLASPRRTICSVQALRAFAAILVLTGHLIEDIAHRFDPAAIALMRLPWLSGVDIFFAISGFIMVHTCWADFAREGAAKDFMVQRLIRIVPMYFLFTSAMVAVVLAYPSALGETRNEPAQIVSSYLFFPYRRAAGEIQPVLATGWTLNYEMYFYALFALTLPFARGIALAALTAMFAALVLLHPAGERIAVCLGFWTDPVILEFLAGALLGALYRSGVRNERSVALGLAAMALAIGVFFARPFLLAELHLTLPRVVKDGLPAFLLVVAGTILWPDRLDARVPGLLRRLGDSSYALYLSHPFVMRACVLGLAGLIHRLGDAPAAIAMYAVCILGACLAVGHAVHVVIERPLTRRLADLYRGAPASRRLVPPARIELSKL